MLRTRRGRSQRPVVDIDDQSAGADSGSACSIRRRPLSRTHQQLRRFGQRWPTAPRYGEGVRREVRGVDLQQSGYLGGSTEGRAKPGDGYPQQADQGADRDGRARPGRRPGGSLIPLAEQDRGLWNRDDIGEGAALITESLSGAPLGPYQLQAAIAAVHDEAARAEDTDWKQIVALYELLASVAPNPMVTLNEAVAVAMVRGPKAGLDLLATLDADERMAGHHRLEAVRAHLLELAGDREAARISYRNAARRTTSLPEQRYLEARAARLSSRDP